MVNAVEIKKRLNTIVEAAISTFNAHKTKLDKNGGVVKNNYNFTPAAKALAQEAFDLGRQSMKDQLEPVKVDHEDPNPENDQPVSHGASAAEDPAAVEPEDGAAAQTEDVD